MLRFFLFILVVIGFCSQGHSQRPFITTWNSANAGITEPNQIQIPGTGTDYLIEWEEVGNPDNSGSLIGTDFTIVTFPSPGIYQISISGNFTRIRFDGGLFPDPVDGRKLISIDQWGDIEWECMADAFSGCTYMEYNATDIPDLSRVESMSAMFKYCNRFNGNINDWDVSNVRDMSQLFFAATSYNQRMTSWDVSNVETMEEMFFLARDFRADIRTWDTGNVRNMRRMFMDARRFSHFTGSWDVSNVENFEEMFYRASAFNQNINDWDLSSARTMRSMFREAESFNQPLDKWRFPNLEGDGLVGLFWGASSFDQNINSWEVSHLESLEWMFLNASSFNQPLENWDVSNILNFRGMFQGASSFNQLLNNWDVSGAVSLGAMFSFATSFNQPLNNWHVSNVTVMGSMFSRATSFNQPLDSWDVSKVTTMESMFSRADSFNQPLDSWDVSNVVSMVFMFEGAYSFNQPLNNWDVSNVEIFMRMFSSAISFNQTLDNWDVSNALFLTGMFYNAYVFDQDLSNWEFNQEISTLDNFFDNSGMSCENYDLTLMGWADNPSTPDDRDLGAVGLTFSQAAEARQKLIEEKGWTFTGDEFIEGCGKDCDLPPTTISIQGQYPTCPGEAVTLRADADGVEYSWYKNGELISGENSQSLIVTEVGLYSVIYTDDQNCESEESDPLEITFLDATDPPILLNAGKAVLRSTRPNCRGFAFWEAELLTCGDIHEIEKRSIWRLDLFNTGQFDILSTQPRPDGSARNNLRIEEELPLGIHRLVWEIRDEHGNLLIEEQLITLVDMNPPNPVCMHGISTNLSRNTGSVTIPARVFDVGSWDDCTDKEDLIFTFSSDLSHTHHTWTCDDLDGEQEVTFTVEIWVTNQYGHQNRCFTYLKVQDNRDACPQSGSIAPLVYKPTEELQPADFNELFPEDEPKPSSFLLHHNPPNPFTSHTSIGFDLPQPGTVKLSIYNPYGGQVYRQSRHFNTGSQSWLIEGGELPHSGFYIYRVGFEGEVFTGRMLRV